MSYIQRAGDKKKNKNKKQPRKGSGNITLTIDYQKTFIRDIISLIQTNCKKYFFQLWVSGKIWKNIHEEI